MSAANISSARQVDPLRMHLIIRRFAGVFILASLVLAHYHSAYWLWFTAFVGFNLLQSSFSNICPLEMILRKFGVATSCCSSQSSPQSEKARCAVK